MSNLPKWVPRLITGIAIIHLAYGVVAPSMRASLGEIIGNGVVNTVDGHPARESWLWFMLSGVAWLALGELARWTARETGRIPARLGAWILAIAVPLTVASPVSGGWLVAGIGLLALRAARSDSPSQNTVEAPAPTAVHT